HRVVAAEQQGDDAGIDHGCDLPFDDLVAALDIAGDAGDVAVVHAGEDLARVQVERRVVATDQSRGRPDGARAEAPAGAERHAGVKGRPDDGDIHVLQRPDVRQAGKRANAGEARALQRVLRDVARAARLAHSDLPPVTGIV